ncbi:hypothetical protein [Caulobacter sp. DWP3-1-3b2]|uniref:hypothetical protein n=1 Tax=Caulobacter sp. DWP3-1-3b2 TaxID=2804643 RepID=UPI003CEA12C4
MTTDLLWTFVALALAPCIGSFAGYGALAAIAVAYEKLRGRQAWGTAIRASWARSARGSDGADCPRSWSGPAAPDWAWRRRHDASWTEEASNGRSAHLWISTGALPLPSDGSRPCSTLRRACYAATTETKRLRCSISSLFSNDAVLVTDSTGPDRAEDALDLDEG